MIIEIAAASFLVFIPFNMIQWAATWLILVLQHNGGWPTLAFIKEEMEGQQMSRVLIYERTIFSVYNGQDDASDKNYCFLMLPKQSPGQHSMFQMNFPSHSSCLYSFL